MDAFILFKISPLAYRVNRRKFFVIASWLIDQFELRKETNNEIDVVFGIERNTPWVEQSNLNTSYMEEHK